MTFPPIRGVITGVIWCPALCLKSGRLSPAKLHCLSSGVHCVIWRLPQVWPKRELPNEAPWKLMGTVFLSISPTCCAPSTQSCPEAQSWEDKARWGKLTSLQIRPSEDRENCLHVKKCGKLICKAYLTVLSIFDTFIPPQSLLYQHPCGCIIKRDVWWSSCSGQIKVNRW